MEPVWVNNDPGVWTSRIHQSQPVVAAVGQPAGYKSKTWLSVQPVGKNPGPHTRGVTGCGRRAAIPSGVVARRPWAKGAREWQTQNGGPPRSPPEAASGECVNVQATARGVVAPAEEGESRSPLFTSVHPEKCVPRGSGLTRSRPSCGIQVKGPNDTALRASPWPSRMAVDHSR